MLGLYGHLAHADAIPYELAAAVYLAYAGFKFRGLLLPALPLRPAGRLRQSLQISSYLARGFSFVYFVAAWAAGYGLWTGAGAYQRAFSRGTPIDHLMHAVAVVVVLVVIILVPAYAWAVFFSHKSVRRWEQVRVQRRRDRRAARTLTAIRNGAPSPYGAYSIWLRPFTSTGRCWVIARSTKAGRMREMAMLTGYRVTVTDLETLLAGVMEPIAPVIALGKSGEQVGAGRIEVPDDRWQEEFTLLARSARAIFLLPSTREGTHWEIDFLLREPALLDRTVFLVPPEFFGAVSGGIADVERDLGARKLDNRGDISNRLFGGKAAKTRYAEFDQSHKVNEEAIREMLTAEGPEARAEALRTLEGILPPDSYATVVETAYYKRGVLLKLTNDGAVRVTALAPLKVSPSAWNEWSNGPRFDQSLLRAGLLKMVPSAGSPPSPPG